MSRTDSVQSHRPRAAHLGPALRRPLVLDAALAVWDRQGYAGTTMAAIAAEAGVSKPVLYECFATKELTLLALLEREEQRLMSAAFAALPAALDPRDPHGSTAAIFVSLFRSVLAHPVPWRVFLEEARAVPSILADRMRDGRDTVTARIADLLDVLAASEGRDMARRETLVRATQLVSLVEDNALVLLHQEPGPDAWDVDELAELLARIVIDGWRA